MFDIEVSKEGISEILNFQVFLDHPMSHSWEYTHQARAHQKPQTDSYHPTHIVSWVTFSGSQAQVSPREMDIPEVYKRSALQFLWINTKGFWLGKLIILPVQL